MRVIVGARTQVQDVIGVNGYLSQGDLRAHFGVGAATTVDRVEIRWPDGSLHHVAGVPVDQTLTIVHDEN